MFYSYLCVVCGNEQIDPLHLPIGERGPFPCSVCGSIVRRSASFSFRRSMQEHFNRSVGSYVSNEREFTDQLKSKSEEASLRTGMDHNFQPVDVTDMKALGVTDEGLEHTHKIHRDGGLDVNGRPHS